MQTGKCIRKRQITLYTLTESTVTKSYNIYRSYIIRDQLAVAVHMLVPGPCVEQLHWTPPTPEQHNQNCAQDTPWPPAGI